MAEWGLGWHIGSGTGSHVFACVIAQDRTGIGSRMWDRVYTCVYGCVRIHAYTHERIFVIYFVITQILKILGSYFVTSFLVRS